ncbi:hypothetical protein [Polaromonas sp.]|uniref:hypothetical protein n=1 Tax=Polaromonas sp. TaxID=1869339 RepID=UPI00286CC61C|nr:hypothetical protein [Polaromonas sp.]
MKNVTISPRAPVAAQITMSRPAVLNAFDEAMIAGMDSVFAQLAADARSGRLPAKCASWPHKPLAACAAQQKPREGFIAFLAKRPTNWIPQ